MRLEEEGWRKMSPCPECHKNDLGIVRDRRTVICLDCGYITGDRYGDSLKHHEGRVERMKLLLSELEELNRNINTDDEIEKRQRLIELIGIEVGYYHQWIGEEADKQYMQRKRKINPRYGNIRGVGSWRDD